MRAFSSNDRGADYFQCCLELDRNILDHYNRNILVTNRKIFPFFQFLTSLPKRSSRMQRLVQKLSLVGLAILVQPCKICKNRIANYSRVHIWKHYTRLGNSINHQLHQDRIQFQVAHPKKQHYDLNIWVSFTPKVASKSPSASLIKTFCHILSTC